MGGAKSDAYAISEFLRLAYGLDVPPGRIRVWAHRGLIHRCGADPRGRTLYRIDEVVKRARRVLERDGCGV